MNIITKILMRTNNSEKNSLKQSLNAKRMFNVYPSLQDGDRVCVIFQIIDLIPIQPVSGDMSYKNHPR